MKSSKKILTIILLVGLLGTQAVNADWSLKKTYNLKANTVNEVHTGGGRLTKTKSQEKSTCAIATYNQTMWTNPSGRAYGDAYATSWIVLENSTFKTTGISKVTGRTYTLQLRGNAWQVGTDSLDARFDIQYY